MVEPNLQGRFTQRTSAKGYHLPNVEIKDYNVMINGENTFDQPIKNNKVAFENIRKIATGQGNDYTTHTLKIAIK